jgi:hypothetical protein
MKMRSADSGGQADGYGESMVTCIYCQRQILVVVVVFDGKYK